MAEVETKITIKLDKSEFRVLQKMLSLQYRTDLHGLPDNEKDLVNDIFFRMNDAESA